MTQTVANTTTHVNAQGKEPAMSEPRARLGANYREQHDLARVIAALLESNTPDTPLALAIGSDPTVVDLEIAGYLLDYLEDRGWTGPHNNPSGVSEGDSNG